MAKTGPLAIRAGEATVGIDAIRCDPEPEQGLLLVDSLGQGAARLVPLFTDAGFVPGALAAGTTAVKLLGQPVVSCPDAKPCAAVYELITGYPAGELNLTWFPRLFGYPAGQNGAVAEVSVNEGPWRPVDGFASTRSGRWDGLGVARRASLDLGGVTGTIRVRFRLTGDGAQVWSSPETPQAAAW